MEIFNRFWENTHSKIVDFPGDVSEWLAILQENIVFVVNFKSPRSFCVSALRIGKQEVEKDWPEDEAANFHCVVLMLIMYFVIC